MVKINSLFIIALALVALNPASSVPLNRRAGSAGAAHDKATGAAGATKDKATSATSSTGNTDVTKTGTDKIKSAPAASAPAVSSPTGEHKIID
ncbi:5597_t:CDS:2 [Gigaspora margarita]|uniref:5597_t:CDS:1 n=1 Tax=Gigaspora margarita TaxID=4874 RepID=A0ABN7UZL7_GIGMA|nr:5597_t:CDS:2 [Gigaspora margarita]